MSNSSSNYGGNKKRNDMEVQSLQKTINDDIKNLYGQDSSNKYFSVQLKNQAVSMGTNELTINDNYLAPANSDRQSGYYSPSTESNQALEKRLRATSSPYSLSEQQEKNELAENL